MNIRKSVFVMFVITMMTSAAIAIYLCVGARIAMFGNENADEVLDIAAIMTVAILALSALAIVLAILLAFFKTELGQHKGPNIWKILAIYTTIIGCLIAGKHYKDSLNDPGLMAGYERVVTDLIDNGQHGTPEFRATQRKASSLISIEVYNRGSITTGLILIAISVIPWVGFFWTRRSSQNVVQTPETRSPERTD